MADKIPKFDDLPLDKAGPPLNAWGLSDSPPTARLIMLIAFPDTARTTSSGS